MTNQSAVIAVVIRDSQANIVRAAAQLVLQTEALVAEALAIRFGLIQAKSLTSGAIICESDASLMVKALSSSLSSCPWPLSNIHKDCNLLISGFESVEFLWTTNFADHNLAKWCRLSNSLGVIDISKVPNLVFLNGEEWSDSA
ncbi:hypothetical protein TIFTF001_012291 [Ficus carica]|uniref:RNase H type-1 domain-containing protein n=1 Tax=Ficus carica TaxID=3494 RepID=A0AA87ZZS3_FICCA|nr:hypothetical protein TIFTF001_012291 [Ficus carica]